LYNILFFAFSAFFVTGFSQSSGKNTLQDSVIQLYGVVMTADSLRAIEAASVIVENKGREHLQTIRVFFNRCFKRRYDPVFMYWLKDKVITI
jgi:hypothetical protein